MSSETEETPYAPAERQLVAGIQVVWYNIGCPFVSLGYPELLQYIKHDFPDWILTEERVKDVKERALTEGLLRKPDCEKPDPEYVRSLDEAYVSAAKWKECMPADVGELSGTFDVTSGELAWGQMRELAGALKTTERDLPDNDRKDEHTGTITQSFGLYFRAPAKNGVWKIAVVEGAGERDSQSGWLAYHTSCDPLSVLKAARLVHWGSRTSNPRITYVNRYDWGHHGHDPGQLGRTLADLDPEIWGLPFEKYHNLWLEGSRMNKYHEDWNMWERLHTFKSGHCSLLDVAGTAAVLKLMARPSEFDTRVEAKQPSSFFFPRPTAEEVENDNRRAFGCNIPRQQFMGYEVARLIFSPNEDELIAFWYDAYHYEYEPKDLAIDPFFEDI